MHTYVDPLSRAVSAGSSGLSGCSTSQGGGEDLGTVAGSLGSPVRGDNGGGGRLGRAFPWLQKLWWQNPLTLPFWGMSRWGTLLCEAPLRGPRSDQTFAVCAGRAGAAGPVYPELHVPEDRPGFFGMVSEVGLCWAMCFCPPGVTWSPE